MTAGKKKHAASFIIFECGNKSGMTVTVVLILMKVLSSTRTHPTYDLG